MYNPTFCHLHPHIKRQCSESIYYKIYSHIRVLPFPLSPSQPGVLLETCLSPPPGLKRPFDLLSQDPEKNNNKKTCNLSTCSATAAVFLSPSAASGVCSGSPTVVRLRTAWCETPHAQSHRGRRERRDITDFLSCSLLWLLTKECKHVKISQRSSSLPSSLVTYCFVFIILLCLSEMHERMPFSFFFWSL